MAKNMYSLMLTAEVVAAIDVLAAKQGYSRSALVDSILAQAAGFASPRRHLEQTAADAAQRAQAAGMRYSISAAGTLTLQTRLRYKYNPAISYVVELYEGGPLLGQLRATLRSQNSGLLALVQNFFEIWAQLENTYLQNPPGGLQTNEPHRLLRSLRRPPHSQTSGNAGKAIHSYVQLFHNCLAAYLTHPEDLNQGLRAAQRQYIAGQPKLGDAALF